MTSEILSKPPVVRRARSGMPSEKEPDQVWCLPSSLTGVVRVITKGHGIGGWEVNAGDGDAQV